jgi:hypothetical protein
LRFELTGKEEIIAAMEQIEEQHQKFFPKVDRRLVVNLRKSPDVKGFKNHNSSNICPTKTGPQVVF